MKTLRVCAIILTAILLLGLILYHIPQQRQISMWTCSSSGESVWVEMNLKYYRRMFRAPTVKGTITFNGETYIDRESMLKKFPNLIDGNSDGEWNSHKDAAGLPDNMVFCKETATDILEADTNRIVFFDVSEESNFGKIHFMYTDDSMMDKNGYVHGISYFGPAQTPEQAQQIADYFGREGS